MQTGTYCTCMVSPTCRYASNYCLGGYVLTPWCVRLYQVQGFAVTKTGNQNAKANLSYRTVAR